MHRCFRRQLLSFPNFYWNIITMQEDRKVYFHSMLRTIVKSQIIRLVNVSKNKSRFRGMDKALFYNCQQCNNEYPPSSCYIIIWCIFIIFCCCVTSPIFTLIWDFLCCQQTIKFLIADPLRRIEMVCWSSQSFERNLQKVLLFQRLKF